MESVDATGTQKVDEKSDHGNEPNSCEIVKTHPSDTLEQESISVKDECKCNATTSKPTSATSEESSEVQAREAPANSDASSSYKIPSHVFERSNTKTPEWSLASNESLFSIHMGTMSFSTEQQNWFKSGELDKYGEMMMSNQPPDKYNVDLRIQDEGCVVTEARAAETMREVIMENSGEGEGETKEQVGGAATSHSNQLASPSNESARSDHGSAKSFAFQLTGDGGKSYNGSSRHFEEKPKQQQQEDTVPLTPKETTEGAEEPTPTNAPSNKRSSCFACFPFCQ